MAMSDLDDPQEKRKRFHDTLIVYESVKELIVSVKDFDWIRSTVGIGGKDERGVYAYYRSWIFRPKKRLMEQDISEMKLTSFESPVFQPTEKPLDTEAIQ